MSRYDASETKAGITPETLMESISDAIIGVDLKQRIQWLNRAAEKMSGLSRTEAIGRPCSTVLSSTMCRDNCGFQRILKAGKPIVDAPAFLISGGRHLPVSVSIDLIRNAGGRVIGGVEIIRDHSGTKPQNEQEESKDISPDLPPTSRSALMLSVLDQLPRIAATASTVLIQGETGTGKELVARTIHVLSPRRKCPFVAVNCGAFTETLLASELFGHKRGAFTGADSDRAGCFAQAKAGTLFLDDVETMSPATQSHLLRVLQEHVYQPVGATRSETTDARIIVATNEDLSEMVRKGTFRQDLYYRVKVLTQDLPPLRKRKEDIPLLVEQMVEKFNRVQGKSIQGIEPKALTLLIAHDWPGNVRELQNAIEHAFIKCGGDIIGIAHLPQEITAQGSSQRLSSDRSKQSKALWDALKRNSFNRLATAKELRIDKTTLYRRMKKLKITCPKRNGRRKIIS
jgi:PAS domain S-box-containing protein